MPQVCRPSENHRRVVYRHAVVGDGDDLALAAVLVHDEAADREAYVDQVLIDVVELLARLALLLLDSLPAQGRGRSVVVLWDSGRAMGRRGAREIPEASPKVHAPLCA